MVKEVAETADVLASRDEVRDLCRAMRRQSLGSNRPVDPRFRCTPTPIASLTLKRRRLVQSRRAGQARGCGLDAAAHAPGPRPTAFRRGGQLAARAGRGRRGRRRAVRHRRRRRARAACDAARWRERLPEGDWHFAATPGRSGTRGARPAARRLCLHPLRQEARQATCASRCRPAPMRRMSGRVADGVFLARDLVNTPTNDMGPDELEQAARTLASKHKAQGLGHHGRRSAGEELSR